MVEDRELQQGFRRERYEALAQFALAGDGRAVNLLEPAAHVVVRLRPSAPPPAGVRNPDLGQFAKRPFHTGSRNPERNGGRRKMIRQALLHRIPKAHYG